MYFFHLRISVKKKTNKRTRVQYLHEIEIVLKPSTWNILCFIFLQKLNDRQIMNILIEIMKRNIVVSKMKTQNTT